MYVLWLILSRESWICPIGSMSMFPHAFMFQGYVTANLLNHSDLEWSSALDLSSFKVMSLALFIIIIIYFHLTQGHVQIPMIVTV